ncbi:hypothetical protein M3C63_12880 [Brevibacterium luteolum]|uniref:hypothetical protein n=1 Tax=Brevibacterium luteolum TaxID=199591 RepID=UPI00223B4568|nr:hypothetical protein [Brevibacterium luteolum]MCT1922743.1 hypothetical protein [Brevibacterium luteolum]
MFPALLSLAGVVLGSLIVSVSNFVVTRYGTKSEMRIRERGQIRAAAAELVVAGDRCAYYLRANAMQAQRAAGEYSGEYLFEYEKSRFQVERFAVELELLTLVPSEAVKKYLSVCSLQDGPKPFRASAHEYYDRYLQVRSNLIIELQDLVRH